MAQSSLFPPEHLAWRVLELACPTADFDLRENCAFLVAQRRLTIDEAIEYANSEAAKDAAKAAAAHTGTRRTSSSSTATTPAAANPSYLPPPPPRQRAPAPTAEAAASAGHRRDLDGASRPAPRDAPSQGELPAVVQPTEGQSAAAASRHSTSNSLSRRSRSDGDIVDARNASTPALQRDTSRQSSSAPLVVAASSSESSGASDAGGAAKVLFRPERRSTQRVINGAPNRTLPPRVTAPPSRPSATRAATHGAAPADEGDAVTDLVDDGEPLLSALKQATSEERAAFEEKQADMLYYEYGEETSMFDSALSRYGPGQVLFFRTSMTGDRAVRDRCRQMENMLFLKLIPHHTVDVADSAFFQQRLRRLYASNTGKQSTPSPPMLFVDKKLIGDFPTVQELEDCGELDTKLLESGCRVLRPRVVEAYGRRKAGLAAEPLVLARSPSRTSATTQLPPGDAAEVERPTDRKLAAPARAAASPPVAATRTTASTTATTAVTTAVAGAPLQRPPPPPQPESKLATARRVSQRVVEGEREEEVPQRPRMLPPPPPIPRSNGVVGASAGLSPFTSSSGAPAAAAPPRASQSTAVACAGVPRLPALAPKDGAPLTSHPQSPPAAASGERPSARGRNSPTACTPPARNGHRRQPPPVYTVSPA